MVRTSENNGIKGYITEDIAFLNNGNTISFGQDTATIFYQKVPYFTGDKIKILSYTDCELNETIANYLLTSMRKAFCNFSWGSSSFNVDILKQVKIMLPISKKGNIDYKYIEGCVHELKEEYMRKLEAYLIEADFENCELTPREKEVLQSVEKGNIRNRLFRIDALFNIATGRDIIIGRTRIGHVPLISHQHNDNGISKRIERLANRRLFDYETTLSLADRGVFLATTQAEDFHIGTRVKALTFKDGKHNENIRLFFVAAINKLQILFMDYLTNATDNLPNLQISVPVTKSGAVDYVFMDTYINAIKKQCIARLKQEIDRERNDTNKAKVSER